MATNYNSKIVTDGLVALYDSANPKSWGLDGSKWKDASKNSNDGSITGPIHSQGPFPGAGYVSFDGNGDYLDCGSNIDFQFGTGDFTAECWVYPSQVTNTYASHLVGTHEYNGSDIGWTIYISSAGKISFYFAGSTTTNAVSLVDPGSALTVNTWYHVAATRSGSTLRLFLNGQLVASNSSVSTNANHTGELYIATTSANSVSPNIGNSGLSLNGYLSNVRVVKGTALYTSNFAPSLIPLTAVPNTKLLTCQGGSIVDASLKAIPHSISVTGNAAAVYNDVSYFEFDGNDDYVDLGTINTSHVLQMNNPSGGGLTVSWWGYFDDTGDDYQRIFDKSNNSTAANGWAIYSDLLGSNTTTLKLASAGSDQVISNSYLTSTWQNWCVTWIKSSGTYVTYLNGVQDKTGTRTWNIPSVQTNARIGSWNHSTTREYNGKIANLKIYDKALTSTEVTQNYNALRGRYGI